MGILDRDMDKASAKNRRTWQPMDDVRKIEAQLYAAVPGFREHRESYKARRPRSEPEYEVYPEVDLSSAFFDLYLYMGGLIDQAERGERQRQAVEAIVVRGLAVVERVLTSPSMVRGKLFGGLNVEGVCVDGLIGRIDPYDKDFPVLWRDMGSRTRTLFRRVHTMPKGVTTLAQAESFFRRAWENAYPGFPVPAERDSKRQHVRSPGDASRPITTEKLELQLIAAVPEFEPQFEEHLYENHGIIRAMLFSALARYAIHLFDAATCEPKDMSRFLDILQRVFNFIEEAAASPEFTRETPRFPYRIDYALIGSFMDTFVAWERYMRDFWSRMGPRSRALYRRSNNVPRDVVGFDAVRRYVSERWLAAWPGRQLPRE